MATITGSQASVVSGGTASFSQFRLTTFVDSTPKAPKTITSVQVPRSITSEAIAEPSARNEDNGLITPISQSLQAYSHSMQSSSHGFVTSDAVGSTSVTSPSTIAVSSSQTGFGILDLAQPPIREGKLGPHRDGRVRNPVPLKLKGKTDNKKGNFAVMHMDMSGAGSLNALPRSEAAQRTSENTANAAKTATKAGYTAVKRRRIETPANLLLASEHPVAKAPTPDLVPSQRQVSHRSRALTLDETKYEQARLLTLLRSINPLTVVDQICKALAFFGGIPGAPPPEDGLFPESADANGSGGLFVGWLSEIFPELDRKFWKPESPKSREESRASRPRGRPKGSKASKARKDKGIKKGPKNSNKFDIAGISLSHLRPNPGAAIEGDNPEEEWVDVSEVDLHLDQDGNQQHILSSTTEQGTGPQRSNQISPGSLDIIDLSSNDQNESRAFGGFSLDYSSENNSNKRRPGRPKGSRNRPKISEMEESSGFAYLNHDQGLLAQIGNAPAASDAQHRPARPSRAESIGRTENSRPTDQVSSFAQAQKKPMVATSKLPSSSSLKRHQGQISLEVAPASSTQPITLSPEEHALVEVFRSKRAGQVGTKTSTNNNAGGEPKRTKGGAGVANNSSLASSAAGRKTVSEEQSSRMMMFTKHALATSTAQLMQNDPVPTPILPPKKRQRKPKDSSTMPASKTPQATESVNPVPAVLRSTTSSSEPVVTPTIPSARPPAQGLEAHYERFTSLSHQGDGQQHLQQQQQQARQDLNSVTRTSPLQSASTYYQQPRHLPTSYEQQFPSHQAPNPYQSTLLSQTDSFRGTGQNATYSSRQQQPSHHFNHFNDSSFIDVPALESVANGAGGVGTYGQNISRSASNGSFGSGAQLANGFDGMSDNDITERLLRGIGRH